MTDEEKKADEASLVDEIVAVARDAIRAELEPLQTCVTAIADIMVNVSRTAERLGLRQNPQSTVLGKNPSPR